jgi:hypothetical protein
MITFTTDQELYEHELMGRIMGCDHSLDLKEFLNQHESPMEYNNVFIFKFDYFCLNWNQYINLYKYKIF